MQKQPLGYPRTDSNKELKAYDSYWLGKISVLTDKNVCLQNYKLPQDSETVVILFNNFQLNHQMSDVPLFYVRIA